MVFFLLHRWGVVPYHKHLINSSKEWIERDEFNVAIVFLQTACEVFTEQVIDAIMQKRSVAWLKEPIDDLFLNYNISNERVRKLYAALTGDRIQDQPFWSDFKQHVELRNKVVHTQYNARKEEADKSLASVSAVVAHLETVVRNL